MPPLGRTVAVLLMGCSPVLGQQPGPSAKLPAAAQKSIKKAADQTASAHQAYLNARTAIQKRLMTDLQRQMHEETRKGNLDGALAIRNHLTVLGKTATGHPLRRQANSRVDLFEVGSIWKGHYIRKSTGRPGGDYILRITERTNTTYRGEVESDNGTGRWLVEGTCVHGRMDLHYTKTIAGRDFVGNSKVRGTLSGRRIVLDFTSQAAEEVRIELELVSSGASGARQK
jgi:hypothetical protein